MIDKTKTYTTRDGLPVRIYCTDGAGFHPVHGAVALRDGWSSATWPADGQNRSLPLVEVKPKHTLSMWLNVYSDEPGCLHAGEGHHTKAVADAWKACGKRFACIHITREITEGEGL